MTTIPTNVVIPDFIRANDDFLRAATFAHTHHDAVGQKREGSGEPITSASWTNKCLQSAVRFW